MIRALLLLLLLGPVAAQARVLSVQSGDHAGFSRLVLSAEPGTDWSFGRTEEGYELRLDPRTAGFDVSRVYDLISRNRLAGISTDIGTGALRLRIGCACHAMPYELGGVLVIDLRDGPAPDGSSFEMSLAGIAMPPLAAPSRQRPRARPAAISYDWLAQRGYEGTSGPTPLPLVLPAAGVGDTLRQDLLRQLSEGATRGVVAMTLPPPQKADVPASRELAQIRVGEDLGLIVLPGGAIDDPRNLLTLDGSACTPDEALDLNAWLVYPDPAAGLALARNGLVREFDAPDPAALTRAVRYLIAIGFGAEARQLINVFALTPTSGRPDDAILMTALTYGVDGEAALTPRFTAMAGCDTAAALWSAVETTGGPLPVGLNDAAVIRAFSALPPGLRRHLGDDLTARFIADGRTETARALTDAMKRLSTDDDPVMRLGTARIDVAMGAEVAADEALQTVAQQNGPVAADALIELAETRAVTGTAITPEQVGSLAALAQEYRGTAREPALRRAAALAMALGGDFDGAFSAAVLAPQVLPDLWRLLGAQASDVALLTHAVLSDPGLVLVAAIQDRRRIAERLVALGLPDAALPWLLATSDDADRLLAATVHLRRRDELSALRMVDGMTGTDADLIRARAEAGLGAPDRAAGAFARSGDAALTQARQAEDWQTVARDGDSVWAVTARLVSGMPQKPEAALDPVPDTSATGTAALPGVSAGEPASEQDGSLAHGAALVTESAAARVAVEALLKAVPASVDATLSQTAAAGP